MGLKKAAWKWVRCKACPLHLCRTRGVFGERFGGGTGPRLLIIGEAPGQIEDIEGRPFVGPSGQLLRDVYLTPAQVDNAFITNTVCCRPPRNRDPQPEEIAACAKHLFEIVEHYEPQGIVHIGRVAQRLAPTIPGLPKVGVYHPAYILRKGWPNAEAKRLASEQVDKIAGLIDVDRVDEAKSAPEAESVVAGGFYYEGEHIGDFCVDVDTAQLVGAVPRKPVRRRR